MKFRIGRHTIRPVDVVEIFDDEGTFIAMLSPGATDDELHVVSKFMQGVEMSETFPPFARIKLDRGGQE